MKLKTIMLCMSFGLVFYFGCSTNSNDNQSPKKNELEISNPVENDSLKILSLGDSYTIGQNVCSTCRFPEQLKDSLKARINNLKADAKVIAITGWTTTNLLNALTSAKLGGDYSLVTLLIGVNNQFQGLPFEVFENEFAELTRDAIKYAKEGQSRLIVISIPDYAYTPFGNGNSHISQDIDKYNNFIENYCSQNGITYVYITDITRDGLENPDLVANDGLHPSSLAYSRFVSRILPIALEKIGLDTN
ncbi:SGNH/GDSL hydrolase family protein [Seonamhaeicola maritimus]|uniref:SGNH/GDSL hydrolase family protein n=1 Tax=Seonamhaeicola maritimus TaxID=2591822 RepID=A0A5C7GGS0_9FLAO|nr:SGNH/GDSL hydrolase family protein [Seonamhaeicola maritimus]TXG36778.1 SGNH/GDSL hydrolase family protein [Seonamhaeicola maritimus]